VATELQKSAADFLPRKRTLKTLRDAARSCKGCDLYKNATQTVFGEGPAGANVMFVGEQPGDQEDRQGRPFVGPAGRLLNKALAEAGIPRDRVYVTNAVKHFKWIWRGKRRLHQKPSIRQVMACRPWLEAELEVVRPKSWFAWVQRRRNLFWPGRCSLPKHAGNSSSRIPVGLLL
jgi:uracil-DNA glycosylase